MSLIHRQILAFITSYIREHNIPPTYEEIGAGCFFASKSAVRYRVQQLAELGYVKITPRMARGIRLVE